MSDWRAWLLPIVAILVMYIFATSQLERRATRQSECIMECLR